MFDIKVIKCEIEILQNYDNSLRSRIPGLVEQIILFCRQITAIESQLVSGEDSGLRKIAPRGGTVIVNE